MKEIREAEMIGIDGGGTKTEFALFDAAGKVKKRIRLGPSNPNSVGYETALDTVLSGITEVTDGSYAPTAIFMGGSGLDEDETTGKMKKALESVYPHTIIRLENDISNVIACGSDNDECLAVICGTGAIVYAKKHGKQRRFGGYGYLLDFGGSGFDIGKAGLNAALREQDGIGSHTRITDYIIKLTGGFLWDHIPELYRGGQSYIASFSECVFKAFSEGDETARRILKENALCLSSYIKAASKICGIKGPVVAAGGIIKNNPAYKDMLEENMPEGMSLEVPDTEPIYGACIRAAMLTGADTEGLRAGLREACGE
ncbi:MAG: XRE family transcriptional regulator [Lachnospiraceae bacterium]|nr:XRE family transcriptional regulator [Lachnospiraceae bacterium]